MGKPGQWQQPLTGKISRRDIRSNVKSSSTDHNQLTSIVFPGNGVLVNSSWYHNCSDNDRAFVMLYEYDPFTIARGVVPIDAEIYDYGDDDGNIRYPQIWNFVPYPSYLLSRDKDKNPTDNNIYQIESLFHSSYITTKKNRGGSIPFISAYFKHEDLAYGSTATVDKNSVRWAYPTGYPQGLNFPLDLPDVNVYVAPASNNNQEGIYTYPNSGLWARFLLVD